MLSLNQIRNVCNIRNVLALNPNFVVKFIKRQTNMVAHKLARAAIVWASRYVVDVLPLCITSLVNNEMIKFLFVKNKNKNAIYE
jgi:hypothetical protein